MSYGGGAAVQAHDTGMLVRSAAEGDRAAWTALVRRFSGLVWSVARGCGLSAADAEEVHQTTWLRLTEHLSRLREPERLGAWLATTARHESLRLVRIGARLITTDDLVVLDPGTEDGSPEQALLDAEAAAARKRQAGRLWAAFQHLPDRCRELLSMLVIASPPLSYAEVSATLGIAVGSIGPIRARCLRQLRSMLAGPASRTSLPEGSAARD
jgi:RNA polymerase sigma factor (sigma-70 family)